MKIDKNSDDAFNLLNWKVPGQTAASRMAGDFAGRCYEVLQKRPVQTEVGDMTIGEVNELLDKLAATGREESQLPILEEFYRRMNPKELMWLIRIILRQMKVGATEKTIFDVWHPDADTLFNISSSLRRVCWELSDPAVRLDSEKSAITLWECFQPQLAQFQMYSIEKMVSRMRQTDTDQTFWIEEKLDGERMQLHMQRDAKGDRQFRFWSRKGKEYTALYGASEVDDKGSLTRHIGNAFMEGVENLILDGEMVTWDMKQDCQAPFGTLKSAALATQRNEYDTTQERPLFTVFDILYLNDTPLTNYTLRDRRKALERACQTVHRRFELHKYTEATRWQEVEPKLRKVIEMSSEGLVLKNPRSSYKLNERNDDWMKVKPEYMTEFGEALDCLIIGGYYGSGKRGGGLSSFLCGLRVPENPTSEQKDGQAPIKYYSFFKVGGGFTAIDYANIRHHTEGKWIDWNKKTEPGQWIELGGKDGQAERPDVWIKPHDSVVVCAKAASVAQSDEFKTGLTLRFPRFKRLRMDKDWQSAMTLNEFRDVRASVEKEKRDKEFRIDEERRQRKTVSKKKPLTLAGYNLRDVREARYAGPVGQVFRGLTFNIITDCSKPEKKSKVDLEEIVKANSGNIVQTQAGSEIICVAERLTVKAASVKKRGEKNLIRPIWLFDCIEQAAKDAAAGLEEIVLPYELNRHLFVAIPEQQEDFENSADQYGDSYARDTTLEELKELFARMDAVEPMQSKAKIESCEKLGGFRACMFLGAHIYFADLSAQTNGNAVREVIGTHESLQSVVINAAKYTARLAGASFATQIDDTSITHVVVHSTSDLQGLRSKLSSRKVLPRMVTLDWIDQSWKEKTLLDAERFVPR